MLDYAWLIPLCPLVGAVVLLFFGKRLGEPVAGWVATVCAASSFILTVATWQALLGQDSHDRSHVVTMWDWISSGGFTVSAGLLVDPLSMVMALFVTGIGTLIHLYAIGYMHGDLRFSRFFAYLNLFLLSMLLLILGENMLMTFLGWEGVGACSYLLISFWFERNSAGTAAKKAFVTNRVGDVGFMLAVFLLFGAVGTLSYTKMFELIGENPLAQVTATAVTLLLLLAAAGKSAQLPLFVWLPDAMEGPTPVSALIHAATMVTAGVYLTIRCAPILSQASDNATLAIAVVGALTALFAATIACAQNDIKRVLAYSTISQLGYMMLAVGSGAYVAAAFHMVTHAFFKALLFLGSGSVIHGMHDEQDMKRMGALRKLLPITSATFLIGWLAIAGVPPFAGFWSKDEILLYAWERSPILWGIGLLTALLTAYYMTRQIMLVFFGEPRWKKAHAEAEHDDDHAPAGDDHSHGKPHESPWLMTAPLVVLAVLSVFGGALNLPFGDSWHILATFLEPVLELETPDGVVVIEAKSTASDSLKFLLASLAAATAFAGIAAGYFLWRRSVDRPELEPELLKNAWYVDAALARTVSGPVTALAEGAAWYDSYAIDGAVEGVATGVGQGGGLLRKVQNGFVRSYALVMVGGVVAVLAFLLVVTR